MAYTVLARKYRPQIFREMVGQEHVLKALINALDHNRLHHAYLFTGTRGVGKTTVARVLAKCLNCEQGVSSEPCGVCSACKEVTEGRSVDLIEVDAASRTKVEDTRELLENVQYAPSRSRFKIYLIDEVHMLSTNSFNALLKTLEEPPEHAKFLLATTDPQKLPATVLSRCLQFHLKNLARDKIADHLAFVLERELISAEPAALAEIARSAEGSMRDALSLTDQAIAHGGGRLVHADVATMLGTISAANVVPMLQSLAQSDASGLITASDHMAEHGVDYLKALDSLMQWFHQIALCQWVGQLGSNDPDSAHVTSFASKFSAEDVQLFYQMLSKGRSELHDASDPKAAFEMILLRLLAFRPGAVFLGEGQTVEFEPVLTTPNQASSLVESAGSGGAEAEATAVSSVSSAPVPDIVQSLEPSHPLPHAAIDSAAEPDRSTDIAAPMTAAPSRDTASNRDELSATSERELEYVDPVRAPFSQGAVPADSAEDQMSSSQIEGEVPTAKKSEPAPSAELGEFRLETATWPQSFGSLGLTGILENVASHCQCVSVTADSAEFVLCRENASLFNPSHVEKLTAALAHAEGCKRTVSIEIGEVKETPAKWIAERRALALEEAKRRMQADEVVIALSQHLDGELMLDSIKPGGIRV